MLDNINKQKLKEQLEEETGNTWHITHTPRQLIFGTAGDKQWKVWLESYNNMIMAHISGLYLEEDERIKINADKEIEKQVLDFARDSICEKAV